MVGRFLAVVATQAHLAVDPVPVSAHCPDLVGADAVIAPCLAKSPEDRFDTCGQFIDALADAAGTGRPVGVGVGDS